MYVDNYWVEIYGEGKPVVLLHGFTGSVQTWQSMRPFFPDHQLIVIDLPGHGHTSTKVKSMADCCNDLYKIFSQLALRQVDLVGYSMGGRTALSFACHYPAVVRTLTLESASPGLVSEADRKARKQKDQELADYICGHSLEAFVEKWENIPLFASQKQLSLEIQEKVRQERLSQSKEGLSHSLLTMGTGMMPSCWNQLDQLKMPVLLVVGEWDGKFVKINEQMEKSISNCQLEIIDQAGHAIHVEQTQIFGTIVEKFIS
ncbi:2-succinyl-6-hydroxy-2,4-cyclohexadiene-1-carboxylate synthase [Gracilibacillus orientalis]|uniref:Putative 2-succinyl-6-hydroxy-2,4-cyclohexadiene-1-carboxylate synthase n=1 Tax=Gracilibacillus orientalis TaxID=334253 RepID=A0A1I4R8M6_9BACI|nr:2-succinyl-6-hydroxy-2,4-cyclohexadiene-1-carboxylate synthase [Gracilibacillus orientalis]SFM48233.1 2-succinyl-6-hydroxy-2,4-cyclohexadiene-1-carboxylate synthase [Gracilibacillus orientalis]